MTRIQQHANRAGLLGAVLLLLVFLLALGGCATRKQPGPPPPEAEPISRADTTARPPVGVVVQPSRSLLDKLAGRTPAPRYYPPGTPVVAGKKSTITINHVAGNQSNTATTVGKKATAATAEGATATTIGKAKGPTAIGDSATAQDFTKQGQRGGAAASGAGATATATTVKSGWPWWLWVLIVGGGCYLAYRGYKAFITV